MQPEILPPKNVLAARAPQLRTRHLPLMLMFVGGSLCALGLLVFGAMLLEILVALGAFTFFAGLILLTVPMLFLAAYRKQS